MILICGIAGFSAQPIIPNRLSNFIHVYCMSRVPVDIAMLGKFVCLCYSVRFVLYCKKARRTLA